jgi:glutamine synthetase
MIETLQRTLKAADVKFVRILWCDNANIIRVKATHIDHYKGLEQGVGMSVAQQALPVMYDAVVQESGLGPVGEAQLVPDWNTLTLLPYSPGHAQVLSDMMDEKGPWEHCPRLFLKGQISRLAEHGLKLRAAFENEFFLLRRTESGLEPADATIYAMTHSMNVHAALINDLAEALSKQGVKVDYYYPESGPGQQEMSIRYTDALQAADQQLIFRETARGVAYKHGLVASFLPKIVETAAGSGCHINLSLWQGGENITGDAGHPTGLGEKARAFMAGILRHLPGLAALTIASTNSYRRIKPHFWAGAYRSWGYGNREASIRVTRRLDSRAAYRFEVKTADATANPYLALGGIMAAGLDGLERDLPLPEEVTVDPGYLEEAERQEKGIDLLPANLVQALDALEEDEVLLSALGEARAKAYLAVKRMESNTMKDFNLEEEVKMLAERY